MYKVFLKLFLLRIAVLDDKFQKLPHVKIWLLLFLCDLICLRIFSWKTYKLMGAFRVRKSFKSSDVGAWPNENQIV